MRDVKFYLILTFGIILAGGAFAADEVETQSDVKNGIVVDTLTAKKIYREVWNRDNLASTSTIKQLEYIKNNNPGLDEDTMIIVNRGLELMKKMNSGMGKKDIFENAEAIQNNPTDSIEKMMEETKINLSWEDILNATDIIEPAKRMTDKIYQDKSLGKTAYPINLNEF